MVVLIDCLEKDECHVPGEMPYIGERISPRCEQTGHLMHVVFYLKIISESRGGVYGLQIDIQYD